MGETGSIGEGTHTHTSVLGEVNKGWRKRRQKGRQKEKSKEKRGERGFTRQSLVGSQVHRSVRWEHTVCTPVQTSWPPLPVSVVASPSDTPPRSPRWGSAGKDLKMMCVREAGRRAGGVVVSILYAATREVTECTLHPVKAFSANTASCLVCSLCSVAENKAVDKHTLFVSLSCV